MNKYRILIAISLLFLMCACVHKEEKKAPLKVLRVGYFPVTNPIIVYAEQADLFKKNGIDLKIENVVSSGSGPQLIEMFLAGKLDVSIFGDQPAVMGWLRGVDVKAVANFPRKATDTWIMVADTNKVKSIYDLRGKKIAVSIGTTSQHWLLLALKAAGMKASDVEMVNVPGGDASVALMTKEIDAVVASEPNISVLEEKKVAYKLRGSHHGRTNCGILLISGNIYRNHPEIIKPLIGVFHDATTWIIDNPDSVVPIVSKMITYNALPKSVIKRQYSTNLGKVKYIGFTDSAKQNYKQIVTFLKELKVVKPKGSLADSTEKFYDSRFVDEYYKDKAKLNHTTVAEIIKRESSVEANKEKKK
jgi:sulfonate transport system substrate-binding protein